MSVVESAFDGGVLTVTLADEANRNVLSGHLVGGLLAALDRADTDPEVRVMVITNSGRVFSAGADLRARASANRSGAKAAPAVSELLTRIRRCPKPVVARIAGHCVAGGMGLAAAPDISVATSEAKFGFTEVRVGVAPAMVSVLCLPKMRTADARAAFLRGNRFSASEAARMGLINTAVPPEHLDEEVSAVVDDLLLGGPNALAASKQVLERVPELGFDEATKWTARLSGELFGGDEAAEGMDAYLNKRKPRWAPPDRA